jgi:O-antigen/teichoic acid export membrane protein
MDGERRIRTDSSGETMRYVPSPTLRSMVVYGASGVAFAGANLLLARVLSTEHYALLTLVVALLTLGYHLAPAGLDAVVTRARIDVGAALLKRVAVAAGLVATALSAAALAAYGVSAVTALLLLVATVAGGLTLVAAARFQSQQRFAPALALVTCPNLLLLLGALATLATDSRTPTLPFVILAVGLVLAAALGWLFVLREPRETASSSAIPWGEAFALAGVSAAGMLLIQLERLVIPYVLPLADLALFGVLGAVAGSLFRLLQMGVGFSLLPRLRSAAGVEERRQLIAHELRLAFVIALAGAVAVLVLTPLVERWLLAGKYHLPLALVLAVLFSGVAKIAHAFAKAVATALATPRELALVNAAGWISVAVAVCAAVAASRWGLTGVIYGVGLGWLTWAVLAFALVVRHLRLPARVPVET